MKKLFLLVLVALMASTSMMAQVAINNTGNPPDGSAVLDLQSTTGGLLPPRLTEAQIAAIANPADGLIVYCTDCYDNAGALLMHRPLGWDAIVGDPYSLPWIPATITDQGYTYIEVMGEDGNIWLDRNLGATQVATSSTDALAYGDLYQWGRNNDGHQLRNSLTTTSLITDPFDSGTDLFVVNNTEPYNWTSTPSNSLWRWDGTEGVNENTVCPQGYHVPTANELNYYFNAAGITNAATAYSSSLKLTMGGMRFGDFYYVGNTGYYWSSDCNQSFLGMHYNFTVNSYSGITHAYASATGMSVRCIKD